MWLFTRYGFFSAVQHNEDRDIIVVRARVREHLEALFARFYNGDDAGNIPAIAESLGTDYRFRSFISRRDFAEIAQELALDVDYPNFKNEVQRARRQRSVAARGYLYALHDVWEVMARLQRALNPSKGR